MKNFLHLKKMLQLKLKKVINLFFLNFIKKIYKQIKLLILFARNQMKFWINFCSAP